MNSRRCPGRRTKRHFIFSVQKLSPHFNQNGRRLSSAIRASTGFESHFSTEQGLLLRRGATSVKGFTIIVSRASKSPPSSLFLRQVDDAQKNTTFGPVKSLV